MAVRFGRGELKRELDRLREAGLIIGAATPIELADGEVTPRMLTKRYRSQILERIEETIQRGRCSRYQ